MTGVDAPALLRRMMAAAIAAADPTRVLALISGGGSSLMPLPVPLLTLEDKITVNHPHRRAWLWSGACARCWGPRPRIMTAWC